MTSEKGISRTSTLVFIGFFLTTYCQKLKVSLFSAVADLKSNQNTQQKTTGK
jgi:hypothetical protein